MLAPTSMSFSEAFSPEWLASLNALAAREAVQPVQTPALDYSSVTPQAVAAVTGSGTVPGATPTGLDGYTSALNKYTDSLGKMGTKDWINAGIGGLQTIGGLIGSFGSLNLANKQYQLQKQMMTTNLANQVTAYNTALEDKARSRGVMEGQSDAEVQAYIDSHKATTGS